jgi:antitoxin Phd
MSILTSARAQNRFGELLDIAQREPVAITRHGRPVAFVVSAQEMADLVELKRRRKQAVREFAAWRNQSKKSLRRAAALLTDEQVNRMVHSL